ncbi:MAG: NAD-dependent epimerase/dehydratase family protein [Actinobacteria bacterium]|nr:NAD-dependent epimerase/dehydratase family protein [Actinomycetota bacterium]
MRVLVTGASSLIGRATVGRLLARGDDVTCFQRSPSGTGARDARGDIRDRGAVLTATDGHDVIVHLAALVAPRPAFADAYAVNVEGTGHVLDAAAASAARLVHVSSPSVAFADHPVIGAGAEPPSYRGPDAYAHAKALAEQLVADRALPGVVVIRPHLVWGPGDTQLVGRIVDRARAGRLALPDGGRALVDTTYVDDAAAALVAAVDRTFDSAEATTRPWVVTGNEPRPVAELVAGILAASGVAGRPRAIPAPVAGAIGSIVGRWWRGDEPPLTRFAARQLSVAHTFDQRDTQRVLRWAPTVGVDEGLARLSRSRGAPPP